MGVCASETKWVPASEGGGWWTVDGGREMGVESCAANARGSRRVEARKAGEHGGRQTAAGACSQGRLLCGPARACASLREPACDCSWTAATTRRVHLRRRPLHDGRPVLAQLARSRRATTNDGGRAVVIAAVGRQRAWRFPSASMALNDGQHRAPRPMFRQAAPLIGRAGRATAPGVHQSSPVAVDSLPASQLSETRQLLAPQRGNEPLFLFLHPLLLLPAAARPPCSASHGPASSPVAFTRAMRCCSSTTSHNPPACCRPLHLSCYPRSTRRIRASFC